MQYPYFNLGITRLLLVMVLSLSFLSNIFAQPIVQSQSEELPLTTEWDTDSPYYHIMAENVIKLDTIISNEDLNKLIATLERIARVEKDKALPQYYLAFAYSTKSFKEKDLDKIDQWCDRSELALSKADEIGGVAKEEILVIRALIQYARLQVDFMGRGMEASAQAERYLREGYNINPNNPRVLAILGQHYLQIPAQVGGSREKSCHFVSLAMDAYIKEKESFPEGVFPIVPHWGELDVIDIAGKFCFMKARATTTKTKSP